MMTREMLQQEIEDTKIEFHKLLDFIPVNTYNLPSDNPAWTVAEVLYHLSLAPRLLNQDVKMFQGQNWLIRLLPVIIPKGLFDWLNKELTRYGARKATPQFLAQQYDQAHEAALKALGEVGEEDFGKRLYYPDWDPLLSGEVTLERLFHYVKVHFDSHVEQLRQVVSSIAGSS